jgi:thiol-disulfide isomerase/thioredoxin
MSESRENNSIRRGVAIRAWVVAAVILCCLGLAVSVSLVSGKKNNAPEVIVPMPGTFGALTFTSMSGAPVSMSRYLGKPILVEIWATWCGPCVKARKVLHKMADEAEQYASLIALSVDRGGVNVVNSYLTKKNEPPTPWVDLMADDLKFRSVIGPHDQQSTIPKLIFVDAYGHIVDIEYGIPNSKWVLNRLKALSSVRTRG